MFISFIGSRGSGKTTIADEVYKELMNRGIKCVRQHEGLTRAHGLSRFFTALYLWRFFNFQIFINFGFRGRPHSFIPSLYKLYFPLAFAHDLHQIASGKSDVLIYDSNVLRGFMALLQRGKIQLQEIANIYKRIVLPKVSHVLLVVIDTDPDEAIERWVARDSVTLSDTERTAAIAERAGFQETANKVAEVLSRIEHVHMVRLSGAVSPTENAQKLITEIERIQQQNHA